MPRKKNVIAPEAQTMDLVLKQKEENLFVASKILKAFNVLQEQEYEHLLYIQTGRNMFQLHQMSGLVGGAILLVIKEQEKGSFLNALEQIGIHPRKAQRYMNYAKRFGKYDKLSYLNNSKLDLLEDLTDPELEMLNAGDEVNGMTLDDWDTMTATQIRARGRETEKKLVNQKERYKKEISEMNDEISALRLKNSHLDPPTKEQLAGAALEPLKKKLFEQVLLVQFHLDEAVKAVVLAQKVEGATFPQLQEWAMAHYEQLAPIGELFDELDKALVNCGPYDPESTGM